jgi:hypothetical protein
LEKSSVYPLMVTPDKRLLIYYNLGLWWMGDFVTNIPPEGSEFKNIMGLIIKK